MATTPANDSSDKNTGKDTLLDGDFDESLLEDIEFDTDLFDDDTVSTLAIEENDDTPPEPQSELPSEPQSEPTGLVLSLQPDEDLSEGFLEDDDLIEDDAPEAIAAPHSEVDEDDEDEDAVLALADTPSPLLEAEPQSTIETKAEPLFDTVSPVAAPEEKPEMARIDTPSAPTPSEIEEQPSSSPFEAFSFTSITEEEPEPLPDTPEPPKTHIEPPPSPFEEFTIDTQDQSENLYGFNESTPKEVDENDLENVFSGLGDAANNSTHAMQSLPSNGDSTFTAPSPEDAAPSPITEPQTFETPDDDTGSLEIASSQLPEFSLEEPYQGEMEVAQEKDAPLPLYPEAEEISEPANSLDTLPDTYDDGDEPIPDESFFAQLDTNFSGTMPPTAPRDVESSETKPASQPSYTLVRGKQAQDSPKPNRPAATYTITMSAHGGEHMMIDDFIAEYDGLALALGSTLFNIRQDGTATVLLFGNGDRLTLGSEAFPVHPNSVLRSIILQ